MKHIKQILVSMWFGGLCQTCFSDALPSPIISTSASVYSADEGGVGLDLNGGASTTLNGHDVYAASIVSGPNVGASIIGKGPTHGYASGQATYYWRLIPINETFADTVMVSVSMMAKVNASVFASKSIVAPDNLTVNPINNMMGAAIIYLNGPGYVFEGGFPAGSQRGPNWMIPEFKMEATPLSKSYTLTGEYYRSIQIPVEPYAIQMVSLSGALGLGLNTSYTHPSPYLDGRLSYFYSGNLLVDPTFTIPSALADKYKIEILEPAVLAVPEPSALTLFFFGALIAFLNKIRINKSSSRYFNLTRDPV